MMPRGHGLLKALCAAPLCLLALPCAVGQEIAYDVASWPEKGHGNHRAVLRVSEPAQAVWAHIEWRRRDRRPETKDIRVFDLQTGARVTNVVRVNVTRAAGELVFQPATVPGEYAVYYLPYDPPGQPDADHRRSAARPWFAICVARLACGDGCGMLSVAQIENPIGGALR